MGEKKPLIVLTGPTASGKTALSVQLAKQINGEIISADSMQVYRHMNIGSAKVTEDEMQGIPHHLIDILEPYESFSVYRFQQLAKQAVQEIHERGHIPIVAGGTGFYIQALLYDINFKEEEKASEYREYLEAFRMQPDGQQILHQMLQQVDPVSAEKIHANNMKKVIRALEYYHLTNEPISKHNEEERKKKSPYDFRYFVLTMDRQRLYQRIENRVDLMLQQGLVEEVTALQKMGYTRDMVAMQGLGYKEILDYLDQKITLDEAVYCIKRDTRHFAKRQLTWFRRESDVIWLDYEQVQLSQEEMLQQILKEISSMEFAKVE